MDTQKVSKTYLTNRESTLSSVVTLRKYFLKHRRKIDGIYVIAHVLGQ